jgi:hypothetical protein
VEEIEEHIKAGKPVMLYFSSAPVLPDSVDAAQYAELKKFKETCKESGIFETYTDLNDFKEKFNRHLQLKLNQDEYFKMKALTTSSTSLEAVESLLPDIPQLSREAKVLLKEASRDTAGNIMRIPHLGGLLVQTNEKQMVEGSDSRSRAVWEGTIEELENAGLIKARGYKRELFDVTREGYELAELLNP